jgi:uncharacterized protein DUF5615
VTAFLIDEMFSPSAATLLRDKFGHDAVHVSELGLQAAEDAVVAAAARAEGRVVVTENVAYYAAESTIWSSCSYSRGISPREAGRPRRSLKLSTGGRRISLIRTWARTGPPGRQANSCAPSAVALDV